MKRRSKKILDAYFTTIPHARGDTPWRPSADVLRTSSGWLIKLDLAGVDPDELDVTFSGNLVVVRGLRRDCEVTSECYVHSMEISYSRFKRSIRLPADLTNAGFRVESRHGMVLLWILTKTNG
jgi:HSP20 family protein